MLADFGFPVLVNPSKLAGMLRHALMSAPSLVGVLGESYAVARGNVYVYRTFSDRVMWLRPVWLDPEDAESFIEWLAHGTSSLVDLRYELKDGTVRILRSDTGPDGAFVVDYNPTSSLLHEDSEILCTWEAPGDMLQFFACMGDFQFSQPSWVRKLDGRPYAYGQKFPTFNIGGDAAASLAMLTRITPPSFRTPQAVATYDLRLVNSGSRQGLYLRAYLWDGHESVRVYVPVTRV